MLNVSKEFRMSSGRKCVLNGANCTIPSNRSVALLGKNGAGKSTLLKMISGAILPDKGRIHLTGSVSWHVGFTGSFHPDLTGTQNTRFIARIYGVDSDSLVEFAHKFSELGHYFDMPIRLYSAGMRSRLAFGVSLGIPFDTYLVDEITGVGDLKFKTKSRALFAERMQNSGAIVVSHSLNDLREMCQSGMVLTDGNVHYFLDLEEAISFYKSL